MKTHVQHIDAALSTERPEYHSPSTRSLALLLPFDPTRPDQALARLANRTSPDLAHLRVVVQLAREFLVVRVVPERRHGRVSDHDGLEVEPTVSDVAKSVTKIISA